ncbi:MAG: SGNH/GDSL hydrolase family protein [Ilumatobacteraceae bacterium]
MSSSVKKSRAAVERRNLIVPQMRDYDELGMRQEWVPHLMYFHPRNVALKSVTTDEFGFRNTTGAKPGAPTALLVGGSSVFGIGATSDAMTIPSLLNTATKYNWLNFGGRAFNSTQEAILVHLSNTKKIEGPIVVMSGVNNLTRSLMSGSFSKMFGAFFHQGLFESQMRSAAVGNRALARQLIAGLRERFGFGKKQHSQDASNPSHSKTASYDAMLTVFERDCEYFQMLAQHNSTSASFVLQPFAPWIQKSLTTQETELFKLLDQEAEGFSRVLSELAERKQQYTQDLQAICARTGMKFVDLNTASELQKPEWLFVDRVHLTDAGYSVVAKLLVRDLSL